MSGVGTVTLTDFLLARIDEDEAVARATEAEHFIAFVDDCDWHVEAEGGAHLANFGRESWPLVGEQVAHIARHDPARVLAECEAKRRIVERCATEMAGRSVRGAMSDGDSGPWMASCTLRHLAAVYADHPDYRDEWRP